MTTERRVGCKGDLNIRWKVGLMTLSVPSVFSFYNQL